MPLHDFSRNLFAKNQMSNSGIKPSFAAQSSTSGGQSRTKWALQKLKDDSVPLVFAFAGEPTFIFAIAYLLSVPAHFFLSFLSDQGS
jgi:hypothetical protein